MQSNSVYFFTSHSPKHQISMYFYYFKIHKSYPCIQINSKYIYIAYKNESTINSKFNHLREKSHIFFINKYSLIYNIISYKYNIYFLNAYLSNIKFPSTYIILNYCKTQTANLLYLIFF